MTDGFGLTDLMYQLDYQCSAFISVARLSLNSAESHRCHQLARRVAATCGRKAERLELTLIFSVLAANACGWPCTGYYNFAFYFLLVFAHTLRMGEMSRAVAREGGQGQVRDRISSTLVIAASITAAVRLAREDISESSPRLNTVVVQCIGLARMILNQIVR